VTLSYTEKHSIFYTFRRLSCIYSEMGKGSDIKFDIFVDYGTSYG